MLLLWIVLPILAFFVSMNATYAYFTSSVEKQSASNSTGIIKIIFTDETKELINTEEITESTKILPGETLRVSGAIKNSGTASCYAILKFNIKVKRSNETEAVDKLTKYYSFNNSTLTEIIATDDAYNVNAFTLNVDQIKNIDIAYEFDFFEYDNTYKNATATYSLSACAIQTANLTDVVEATRILLG